MAANAPTVEERIPAPVAASLLAVARAGELVGLATKDQEGPSPSMVGQGLASSPAEQRCIVPRSTGRAVFGVEEVNAAGVQPQALTSGLVLSDAPEKSKFKQHPASTDLLQGGKRSSSPQPWAGAEPGWRSPCPAAVPCLEVPAGSQPGPSSPN